MQRVRPRAALSVLLTTVAVCMLPGCATTVAGNAVSVFDDPFKVGGLQAVDGPSGLRPDAEKPTRKVTDGNGGQIDKIAVQSVSDIEAYWEFAFPETFNDRPFKPVKALISWDSDAYDGVFCDEETSGLVNAAYCDYDNTIGWDRGVLLPSLRKANGDMAITMVLAHEYGHAIQKLAHLNKKKTPALVSEQQADCFAGVYVRWVAEGNSPRFTVSTGDGLNNLLAGMISFRDPLLSEDDYYDGGDEHGSAFERISAFQFGFTDGPSACAAIDTKEIAARRGDLPVELPSNETGELPVTEESTRSIIDAMNILFKPEHPPALTFDEASAQKCPDARPSPPASYCPATNTIAVALPELQKMGTSTADQENALLQGDNTAYSVLVSRYVLALQRQHGGLILDNAEAGLRTACMTGVATARLSKEVTTPDGTTVGLTAGDIDEAISGLLTNGLVASDVNGETVPAGFSRIDAFRIGVLGDQDRCIKRFP